MGTKGTKAAKIAVLFCKDFPGVVCKALRKEAQHAEVSCRVLDGFLISKDTGFFTLWTNDSEEIIASMLAEGYTATGYFRLSDAEGFVPFDDEVESAIATAVNMHALERLSLEVGPAKPN